MFDEIKKEDQNISQPILNTAPPMSGPPAPKNVGVDDMFQETDPTANKTSDAFMVKPSAMASGKMQVASPQVNLPKMSAEQTIANNQLLMGDDTKNSTFKKGMIASVGVILVALVSWGAYAVFFANSTDNNTNVNANEQNSLVNNTNTENNPTNTEPVTEENNVDILANDDDKDGLSNSQEDMLRTDPNNPDTDDDGLFDKEEVKVYLSDPLNPDTDNDGLFDKAEVSIWQTQILDSDTDNDGYLDGIEVANRYNPLGEGELTIDPNKELITQ